MALLKSAPLFKQRTINIMQKDGAEIAQRVSVAKLRV